MQRDVMTDMEVWNSFQQRKPLILLGARQTGKTWLLRAFSKKHYPKDTLFVDLHDNEPLRKAIEEETSDALGILELVSTATGMKIVPGRTLLVFDEVQESPRTLSSLKYFYEKMPDLAIMAAGSLLGLALNRERRRGKAESDWTEVAPGYHSKVAGVAVKIIGMPPSTVVFMR